MSAHPDRDNLQFGTGDSRPAVDCEAQGVFRLDCDGILIDADARAAEILGYAADEMPGLHFSAFHFADDLPRAQANLAQRRQGLAGVSEYRLRRKDGTAVWATVSSVPTCDAGGASLGITGFIADIDQCRRLQALAAHERRLLRRIAGSDPLAVVLDDLCLTLQAISRRPLQAIVMLLEGAELMCVAAPGLPARFREEFAAIRLADSGTACAEAVRSGRPTVVADLGEAGASPEAADLRRNYGVGAVWSYPVVQDGATLGTLALLLPAPGAPDAEDGNAIEFALEVARLALAHTRKTEALRLSEERFRDYAELSADWFWEQDADFRFTAVSYGPNSRPATPPYYDQGSIGKHRWELPYVNVPEGFWQEHRSLLQAGRPFSGLRLQRRDDGGQLRHVEISGRPVYDDCGRLAGYRGIGRDITQEVAARERLEKTQRWLEQAVRAANIGLWERNPDTWDFRFTDNWKSLFGYAESEVGIMGADFDRLVHPDDLARVHAFARAYAENPQGDYENRFRVRHKDGSWRWVLSRGSIVADGASGQRTWMGCHIDLTEQSRAEEALRASEALLGKMLELLPVGVWIIDAAGNIVRANEAGRRIWAGIRHVGIEQYGEYKGWWLASGKRIEAQEWAAARAITKGETSLDEEIEIECFDGSRKIILNSAMPILDRDGAISGCIAVNHDITQRWRAERRIRELAGTLEARVRARTAELEDANRELDDFNFSVSHDLRTPLRAIEGFSQALLEDCSDHLDATGRDHLQRIVAATARMGERIEALYELARLQRASLQLRPLDLAALAHELVAELREAEPHRAVETDIAEVPVAEGDPRMLRIVLASLLGNAWKFTARGAPARIAFGARTGEDGRTLYFVRDNGTGFDMRFADKLFRMFHRLHREEEFAGRGVGLATAQCIVSRHGGRMWAESARGAGATFFFTLWENADLRSDSPDAAEAALQE